jgi:hypothetical protein
VAARGPVRRLARALCPQVAELPRHQRDAVNALAAHVPSRFDQNEFEPFDDDGRTFLSNGYMRRRLREVGARCTGEKAAAQAIRWLCTSGILENMYDPRTRTGEVKKPRRRPNRMAAREKFQRGEDSERGEGGRDSQPSLHRSFWWRIYRIVPLSAVLRVTNNAVGAYSCYQDVPQALASLSAWAVRQGLISRRPGRRGARPGSVQWAFYHSGPP